jgi:DNA-binding NarL/FixJ family response regulator
MFVKPKLKILLVDDNQSFVKVFDKLLRTHFDSKIELIDHASNGQECIDLVHNNTYDLVFMDMEMPIMNGVQAARYISENFRGIKVIAVSLHSEIGNIQKMIEAGARTYIIKERLTKDYIEEILTKF